MPFNDSLIAFRVFVYILSVCYFQNKNLVVHCISAEISQIISDLADYQRWFEVKIKESNDEK